MKDVEIVESSDQMDGNPIWHDLYVRGIPAGYVTQYTLGSFEGGYQWWAEWSERFEHPKYPNVTAKSKGALVRKIKERFGI